ncbi:MAG: DUF4255 domain-containing protein [Pseudomonadaceae bacterium]|nr:DUF4255 domain-containing protein [Pseudomonadaceae bacterium]
MSLYSALAFVAAELNVYLRQQLQVSEDLVLLAPLVEADGSQTPGLDNKLSFSLLNVALEPGVSGALAGAAGAGRAPANLNLEVLIAASFSGRNYPQGLALLSAVMGFFQAAPLFNRQRFAALPEGIELISLELRSLSHAELQQLWTALNTGYRPSLLYKVWVLAAG